MSKKGQEDYKEYAERQIVAGSAKCCIFCKAGNLRQ